MFEKKRRFIFIVMVCSENVASAGEGAGSAGTKSAAATCIVSRSAIPRETRATDYFWRSSLTIFELRRSLRVSGSEVDALELGKSEMEYSKLREQACVSSVP